MAENIIVVYKGPERRRYKRIKKPFLAQFREKSPETMPKESVGQPWHMVTVRNLGGGGSLFNYDKKLNVNSLIDMNITFPTSKFPITTLCKITRIESDPGSVIFKHAASFVRIEEMQRGMIDSMAENFYSKRPGQIEP